MIDGEPMAAPTAAPRLGEHTEAMLAELGLTTEAIAALRQRGTIDCGEAY